MKKLFSIFALGFVFTANQASAQLNNGSTAPDFTFVDTKGNSHNLYTYLNEGKYVALDIFATWCGPCYDFHLEKYFVYALENAR